jgi:hypothetical protein
MRGFIDRRMRYSDVVVIAAVVVDIKGIMIEGGVDAVVVDVVDVVVMEVDIKVIGRITTLMTTASSGSSSSKKMDLEGQGLAGIGLGREMRGEGGSEGGGCL